MSAYYNEIDPYAAQWLRNLIAAGKIADGEVDERSIEDITPSELRGFTQCHFFAGIGIWSLALRNAGWVDQRPIWTGSCPCQPFSAAGKGVAFDDERHLWPHWFHLIEECQPEAIMGEQVASKDGLAWLDLVSSDMEGTDHTFWAVDTCVAGFGGPHLRQRLYWVAYAGRKRLERRDVTIGDQRSSLGQAAGSCIPDDMAHTTSLGRTKHDKFPGSQRETNSNQEGNNSRNSILPSGSGDTDSQGIRRRSAEGDRSQGEVRDRTQGDTVGSSDRVLQGLADPNSDGRSKAGGGSTARGSDGSIGNGGLPSAASAALPTNGFWGDIDWVFGKDGYFRPIEPGTSPLADGNPTRVGQVSAYGNAICAAQATGFIEAVMT